MERDVVWFCEHMMGVKLLPHQKTLLKMVDKVEKLRVFYPRCYVTHDAEWMAAIVMKMLTDKNNKEGSENDKQVD